MTDNSHRAGVTTVQRIGPWQVTTFRPHGFMAGGPREIHIEPAEDGDPQEIARGISSTVLRQISTTTPGQDLARQRAQSAQETALGGLSAALSRMPKGVSDEYLAVLSAFYVRVVEIGTRAPVQDLEGITGTKQATLKGHLRAARQRGFLTKVEGKAGGQLTDKAHEVLKGIKPSGDAEQERQS
ncbi:hypothetical protein [Streptomyces goshikiensis]|uniref:hypothetical protein n=1 Tax=Streptomyces goshikiensis TaxID=1942 RepID=UPI003829B219